MSAILHLEHHMKQHKEDILFALQIPLALLALALLFFLG